MAAAPVIERLLQTASNATPAQKQSLVKASKKFYTKKRYRKLITQNTDLWQELRRSLGEAKTEPMVEFLLHNGSSRIWQRSDKPANPDELLFTLTYYASTVLLAERLLGAQLGGKIPDRHLALRPLRKVFGKSALKAPNADNSLSR